MRQEGDEAGPAASSTGGRTFAYPDSLTAYQWSCIRSLERARQKDQEREQRKQQQQSEQAALQARMKSRMGG